MILYLDTSTLVKLYVPEDGSEQVRELVAEASYVATCCIAYPEFYSALTRRFNSKELAKNDYTALCAAFDTDWSRIYTLDFDEIEAGRLVCKHGLRGADAVHLASLLMLAGSGENLEIVFSSADKKLNHAAQIEGLMCHAP